LESLFNVLNVDGEKLKKYGGKNETTRTRQDEGKS